MRTTLDHVSILAIVAATIAVMALGALWFTMLFERPYAVVLGRGSQPKAKMAPLYFVGPSLCVLVTTVASAILMSAQRIGSWGSDRLWDDRRRGLPLRHRHEHGHQPEHSAADLVWPSQLRLFPGVEHPHQCDHLRDPLTVGAAAG